ncbi:flagellar basal body P-ring formation chaperone FlgA [bacterium]|nr:flagellar basal body P-ring formation chaperone FlgA [bacterium]
MSTTTTPSRHDGMQETLSAYLERRVAERRSRSMVIRLACSFLLAFCSLSLQASGSYDAQLHDAVKSFVVSQLGLPGEDILIELTESTLRDENSTIYDEIRVLPTKKTVRRGLQMIRCGLFFKSQLQQTVLVKILVRTFQNVVVSSSDLSRHQLLRPEDLKLDRRETTRLKRKFYLSVAEAVGMQSKRRIPQDEILYSGVIETPPLIKRGSEIEIHFNRGALSIVLPGVARQDGHMGKPIAVKCPDTRRVYNAYVLDAKTVIVNLL